MQRRHRRPCIWGSADCDSFCKLWWMEEGMSVPSLICMVLGGSLWFFADSWQFVLQCLRCLWRVWYEKWKESLNICQNWAWKDPLIIKNETSWRFVGVVWALGFMNAERRTDKYGTWRYLFATWSISCSILAPTGFGRADPFGVSRCICSNCKN